jgi:hypothetical protein
MREWWRRQSPERKRAIIDSRKPQKPRPGRRVRKRPILHDQARAVAKLAIARGDLVRQPCEVCGVEPAQAHHDDYSKPLDVRWLCRKHHGEQHRKYVADEAAA